MNQDYYILRKSKIIPGRNIKLYKLEESADSLLRYRAMEIIKNRGLSEGEAEKYLDSLEYAQTRDG